jgi:hypothetical protein
MKYDVNIAGFNIRVFQPVVYIRTTNNLVVVIDIN